MDCINSRRYVTTTGMENKHYTISNGLVWFGSMVLNATFNNISVISWRSVLMVEETEVPGENHRSIASNWQTLSHNVVHLAQSGIRTHNISWIFFSQNLKKNTIFSSPSKNNLIFVSIAINCWLGGKTYPLKINDLFLSNGLSLVLFIVITKFQWYLWPHKVVCVFFIIF